MTWENDRKCMKNKIMKKTFFEKMKKKSPMKLPKKSL